MAPSPSGLHGQLSAPFLQQGPFTVAAGAGRGGPREERSDEGVAGSSSRSGPTAALSSLTRRLFKMQLPDPTLLLTVFAGLMACACFADRFFGRGASDKVVVGTLGPSLDAAPVLGEAVLPVDDTQVEGYFGVVFLGAVMALLVCQYIGEKAVKLVIVQALRAADVACLGLKDIEWGSFRIHLLLGQIEVRNCVVGSPQRGYRCDEMLRIRRISAQMDYRRSFLSLGKELVLRAVQMDGVSVCVESTRTSGGGIATTGGGSNLEDLVAGLEEIASAARVHKKSSGLVMKALSIQRISASAIGGPQNVKVSDILVEELSKEDGIESVEQAFASVARRVGDAVMRGLASDALQAESRRHPGSV